MRKTISSLAILKAQWDVLRKDYIEIFIPFIATLINQKNYKIIDVEKICEDFRQEFGLDIPYHPMVTILNRAKNRGLIEKSAHQFLPVRDRALELTFHTRVQEHLRQEKKVMDRLINFAKEKYDVSLSKEEANLTLISFLKDHDLEILFAAQNPTVLPTVKSSNKEKFVVCCFIDNAYESDNEVFRFIVDVAIGQVLASSLLYDRFDRFQGKLKGVNFYFDTAFIFQLLGLGGEAKQVVYTELVKSLASQKANLFLFRHTYEEVTGILQSCATWLGNPLYDPAKASRVLRHFVELNYTPSDLERYLVSIDDRLQKNGISVQDGPSPTEYEAYQIDEVKLYSTIVDTYTEKRPYFEEQEKDVTLRRDVQSIANIHRLRKGHNPRTIKDARSVFVTTNSALAYAVRRFEISEHGDQLNIPTCLTDIFVGTLVWLQSPAKAQIINERKMIAQCRAALQPSPALIGRFVQEIEKLKKEDKITEEQYYLLRTHRVVMHLLQEKTMGDIENFTPRTPEEILEEMTREIRSEAEIIRVKLEKLDSEVDKRAYQIAKWAVRLLFWFLIALLLLGGAMQIFPHFLEQHRFLRLALTLVGVLAGLTSIVTGLNLLGVKHTVTGYIQRRIIGFFKPAIDRSTK
jgi:hypothetical protein